MAVGTSRIARDIAFTLERKSPEIFENIFLQNGVLALMGATGRVRVVKGGNRFDERVHLGQNSTVAAQSKYAQLATTMQNNFRTAEYGQSVVAGTAVVNLVEQDQNMGQARLDNLAQALIDETKGTFANKIGDLLMSSSTAETDPLSIRETIEATAQGDQTSTTGGIARSDYRGVDDKTAMWQNFYSSTAIADIGSAAGTAAVCKFLWNCSPGGAAKSEQPNIGLTTTGVFAKLSGNVDYLKRYQPNAKLAELGFDTLKINNCALMADRNVPAGYLYALNTNYLRVQVLGGPATKTWGDVKTVGDGKQSIMMQVRPAIEADDYLNYTIKMYVVFNLTFGGLRQHGLQVSITEA